MAGENKIWFRYTAGANLYVMVYDPANGEVCDTLGAFEVYDSFNRDTYGLEMTEIDTGDDESMYYASNIGDIAAATVYPCAIYVRAGLQPAEGDQSVGSGDLGPASSVDIDAIVDAIVASGAMLVNVAPLSLSLATGLVTQTDLTAYQYAASTYIIACVDSTSAPYNLSGKTVKFSAFVPGVPGTEIFNVTGSVGGTDNNQVTVIVPQTATQTARILFWRMWNTSDDVVIGSGSLDIKANPDRT